MCPANLKRIRPKISECFNHAHSRTRALTRARAVREYEKYVAHAT
jgi:hypothetical protein